MFNSTKYTKIYFKIINNAIAQNRKRGSNYYELHHIYPKSLGGANSRNNLVLLLAKEHFVVHHLLTKMLEDKQDKLKMVHAFWRMCHAPQQKQRISQKVYERLRMERSKIMSDQFSGENNHFHGKTHTNEAKMKMKSAAVGRNPHDYFDGKTYPSWNKGLSKDNSNSLKRISVTHTGSGNPMFGVTGKDHPNTLSYTLYDSDFSQIKIFHSRKQFNDFCKTNGLPFNGLYKTSKNESLYYDNSKNHRYDSFNGWSLRILEL